MSGNRENYMKRKNGKEHGRERSSPPSGSSDKRFGHERSRRKESPPKNTHLHPSERQNMQRSSGNRQKNHPSSKGNKLPFYFAAFSFVLVIIGVIIIFKSPEQSTAAAPKPTPEEAIDFHTFTYEDGLVTMGLKTAAEVSQEAKKTSEIMIPPKAKEYDPIIYSYPAAGKRVALTFDDGPSSKMTKDYLNVLDQLNIKASFFMLGNSVMAYPDLAKEVEERGHDVLSHSKEHAILANLSTKQLEADFSYCNDAFREVLGHTPKMVRPPYGSYTDEVLSISRKYGQIPIYWSIDTNDWRKYSTETMVNTIVNNLSDGGIILMHEAKGNTLEALPAIAEAVRAQGYEFVPLSELLSY